MGEKHDRNIAAHLGRANPEYRHPFLVKRDDVKDVGLIVVTSDKGLCGGLNTNALRLTFNKLKDWQTSLISYKSLADTGSYPGKEEIADGLVLVRKLLAFDSSYKFIELFNGQKVDLLRLAPHRCNGCVRES